MLRDATVQLDTKLGPEAEQLKEVNAEVAASVDGSEEDGRAALGMPRVPSPAVGVSCLCSLVHLMPAFLVCAEHQPSMWGILWADSEWPANAASNHSTLSRGNWRRTTVLLRFRLHMQAWRE